MTDQPEGFPSPDDFPNYDTVDSRTVLDPEGSFSDEAANFEAEPDDHGEGDAE